MIKEHDRVVLKKEVPDQGLKTGDVGTVITLAYSAPRNKFGSGYFSLKVMWLYVKSAACRGFPEDTLITCPQFFNELTYLDGNKEWDSHGRRQSADWR